MLPFVSCFPGLRAPSICSLDLDDPIEAEMLFRIVDVAMGHQIHAAPSFGQGFRRDLPPLGSFGPAVVDDENAAADLDGREQRLVARGHGYGGRN